MRRRYCDCRGCPKCAVANGLSIALGRKGPTFLVHDTDGCGRDADEDGAMCWDCLDYSVKKWVAIQ